MNCFICRNLACRTLAVMLLCLSGSALGATSGKILRDGQATYGALDPARLPAGTSPKLFSGELSGMAFELFVRSVDAQAVTIELGFVDTQSKGAGEHACNLAANGTPLDANLDIYARAGGSYKPSDQVTKSATLFAASNERVAS